MPSSLAHPAGSGVGHPCKLPAHGVNVRKEMGLLAVRDLQGCNELVSDMSHIDYGENLPGGRARRTQCGSQALRLPA